MADFSKFGTVLKEGPNFSNSFSGDVGKIAEEKEWLKEVSPGVFLYRQEITGIFTKLRELFEKEVVYPMEFGEMVFSRLLLPQTLADFGCIKYTPELLFEATRGSTTRILDPVQCAPLYEAIRGQTLNYLPLLVYEPGIEPTFRNEKEEELDSFFKAKEFRRLELIYIGTPDQVRETRRTVEKYVLSYLTNLEINWRTTVGEPCCGFPETLDKYKKAQKPDEIPIHDIEVWLPHKEEWREIAGCGIEYDRLVKAFNVGPDQNLWSGCTGLGLNRLAYAFLAQHGFDKENWPAYLRE
ncbi:aminoacyl--tRNA ligase-related protein [Nanoarchaeota archaeon]